VVVWGAAFSGIKVVLRQVGPFGLTFARLGIAATAFTVVLPFLPKHTVERRPGDMRLLVLLGVVGAAAYHLTVNIGERYISAGLASLIVAAMPAIVAALSVFFLKVRITAAAALSLVIAFVGVAVLALSGQGALSARNIGGVGVTLLAPISWALYTILAKPLAGRYDGVRLNVIGAWVGAVIVFPFAIGDLHQIAQLDAHAWRWLIFLGAFSTAGSYVVYSWALSRLEATAVASFVQLVPASSLLWAWFLLGEVPARTAYIGGALVVLGVAWLQWETRPRSSRSSVVTIDP
jgi:drug/metabolite transporter (DMT)-like permease